MGKTKAFTSIIAALLIVVVALWALARYGNLQASLVWTALFGGIAWLIRSNVEQKREHRRLLADRKREHYILLLEFMARFFNAGDLGSSEQPKIAPAEFRQWSMHLTLIGSDDVVRAWNNARRISEQTPDEAMRAWGKLWLEMRRDCGHFDTKLGVTDVLASVVNDAEQLRSYLDW